jgi:hypothetical protein
LAIEGSALRGRDILQKSPDDSGVRDNHGAAVQQVIGDCIHCVLDATLKCCECLPARSGQARISLEPPLGISGITRFDLIPIQALPLAEGKFPQIGPLSDNQVARGGD